MLILLGEASPRKADAIVRPALDLGPGEEGLPIQPVVMSRERFGQLRDRERIYALDVLREGAPL